MLAQSGHSVEIHEGDIHMNKKNAPYGQDAAYAERGNALFLILIAVVLFAALSYAITQSNRGGAGAKSETASLAASQIMQYATGVNTGVMRLMMNNVDPADIKFNTPREAAFTSDTKEQVFHPDGGGAAWAPTDNNLLDTAMAAAYTPTTDNGYWQYYRKEVKGIGSDEMEWVLAFGPIKKDVCEQINLRIFGSKDAVPMAETSVVLNAPGGTVTMPNDKLGSTAACIVGSDLPDAYGFFQVLSVE